MGRVGRFVSTIWNENVGLDRCAYLFSGASWQINKRLGREFVKALPNGAKLRVYLPSAYSGVFYCRWPDRKDLLFIRANASLGKTFVDVGANVGIFSARLLAVFDSFGRHRSRRHPLILFEMIRQLDTERDNG